MSEIREATAFGLDSRHEAIQAFDPQEAKHPTFPEWGKAPFQRVDTAHYISPEHVALERKHLWPYVWQVACREEEIPQPGDYFEYEIGDQSVLVTRTPSGSIKAYFNSCLHRGTQLAKGCGQVKRFVCPYHGWQWSLNGANLYVHDHSEFPGLTDEDLRLPEAEVGAWGGFVFVKLTEGGPSLEEYLSPVTNHLAPYRLEDYRIQSWRTTVTRANWKTALEAFEEVYHMMGTHPQTIMGNCDVTSTYETFGAHSRMIVPTGIPSARFNGDLDEQVVLETAIENLLDIGCSSEVERRGLEELSRSPLPKGESTRSLFQKMNHARYNAYMPDVPPERYMDDWDYTIFPNLVFNLFPGYLLGFMARPNGSDPDSCIFDVMVLIHPAGQDFPPAKRECVTDPAHDWGVVLAQDFANISRVQQGMHQRTTKATRLAGYQEKRILNRIRHINQYYRNGAR